MPPSKAGIGNGFHFYQVSKYRTAELICELRLRRPPRAPLTVNFDLCTRMGAGGPILAITENVPPQMLHKVIKAMLADNHGKLTKKCRVIGILGDD